MRDISGVLARHGANIEELVTDSSSAPMSGELLFRAHMRLNMPQPADLARLRGELERFATDLMVELRLVETVTKGRPSAEGGEAAITESRLTREPGPSDRTCRSLRTSRARVSGRRRQSPVPIRPLATSPDPLGLLCLAPEHEAPDPASALPVTATCGSAPVLRGPARGFC